MAEQVNINVVERIPPLSIKLSDQAHAGTVITTEGMPPEVAE
jgi:hypothetical protein